MNLTKDERAELQRALVTAFPTRLTLSRMFDQHLDVNLDRISAADALDDVVFAVIRWAQANGRVNDLINGACAESPGNELLASFCNRISPPPELRQAYADYLIGRFGTVDLRGLVPPEHTGLLAMQVPLREIYVPLTATVVDHSRDEQSSRDIAAHVVEQAEQEEVVAGIEHWLSRWGVPEQRRRSRVSLATTVSEQQIVVILGDPGSGKSAFLKQHALELLEREEGRLPIWLPLAAYAQALEKRVTLRIEDYAAQYYGEQGLSGLAPLFAHAARGSRAVYLLDGLDEVASEWRNAVSDRVVSLIRGLAGTGNRLLVTSRITGYIPLAADAYNQALLEPFGSEQISLFVRNWYNAVCARRSGEPQPADKTAERLLRVTQENPGVQKLVDNPLTLTMLTLLFYAGNADLPRQRVKLYGLVAKTLIEEWRKARSGAGMPVGTRLDEKDVVRQIGELAYWMHDERPAGLATQAEIEGVLVEVERVMRPDEDPLPGVRRFLDTLSREVGILSPKGSKHWGFSHQTFQEYFAARQVVRWREQRVAEELTSRAVDPRWTEVIRLVIAYIGSETVQTEFATELLEGILDRPDVYEKYLHRNLLLAGRVLADDPGVDRPLAASIARQLFDLFLNSSVEALVADVGLVLRELLGTGLRPVLLKWIAEEIKSVLGKDEWGTLAQDVGVYSLLLPFLADEDASVRGQAASALGQAVDDPVVREGLLGLLTDEDASVRRLATSVLRQAVSDPVVQAKLLGLLTDEDAFVRVRAASALRQAVDDPLARETLLRLTTHQAAVVRGQVASALGQAVDDPVVREATLRLLTDEDASVRSQVASALRQAVGDPVVQEALLGLLTDEDASVRANAALSLGQAVGDPAVRQAMLRLLTDSAGVVRGLAASALGQAVDDPVVREALLRLLTDQGASVRGQSAYALRQAVGDPRVQEALLGLLTDEDAFVRANAASALRQAVGDPPVREALLWLLTKEAAVVRGQAASALGQAVGDPVVREALLRLLTDEDAFVRGQAGSALRLAVGDPVVRDALLWFLTDTDSSVRSITAKALLAALPDVEARGRLLSILEDRVTDEGFTVLSRWAEIEHTSSNNNYY